MSDTGDASGWPDVVGLRDRGDPWVMLSNARAEIERLQSWLNNQVDEIKRKNLDIERLTESLRCFSIGEMEREIERLHGLVEDSQKQRAEIERLTAALREYACTGTDHPCGCYDQFLSERAEIERLTAQNERLVRLHQMTMPEQVAEIERLNAENNAWIDRDIERNDREAELLAALRGVIEWWDADGPHRAEPDFVTEARSAIAKAEGMK